MYNVYIINKNNRQRVRTIASGLTEQQADRMCEQWGWTYSDESGTSFWMDYEEDDSN